MKSQQKPICVIIDTNVWRSHLLLRVGLGPALLHVIHRRNGKIGMPEVIENEIKMTLFAAGCDAVEVVRKRFQEINSITGSYWPFKVPSERELQHKIDARLAELEGLFERVEITLEQTRSALVRVYKGSPPNGPKNQQFKDSMIWEAILDLGRRFEMHFITEDSGFYRDNSKTAIAAELEEECKQKNITLCIYSSPRSCLEELRTEMPELDKKAAENAVWAAAKPEIDEDAQRRVIRITDFRGGDINPFCTVNPDVLSLAFRLRTEGIDQESPSVRDDIRVIVEGNCNYSVSTGEVTGILLDRINYEWTDETGERRTAKSAFARVGGVLGFAATAPIDVRRPISDS